MSQASNEYVEGTATDFIQEGWKYNGRSLDAVAFSILSKYGVIQVVGKTEKAQGRRGKPGAIFSINRSYLTKG